MIPYDELKKLSGEHPYPLLFVTLSGAHLYGFPSPDSDFDLRGVHMLPLNELVGLKSGPQTIEQMGMRGELEIDLVTHEAAKYFHLLLKRNGYVLEQILSPLVVLTTPEHLELKRIARTCVTRHHASHYRGFADTQRKLFEKESPPRVKPLLYTFRVLLTGIHLMRTGEVEPDLRNLNIEAKLPYIDDLIGHKVSGQEKTTLQQADLDFYRAELDRLETVLLDARDHSHLPETNGDAAVRLNELLLQMRLGSS